MFVGNWAKPRRSTFPTKPHSYEQIKSLHTTQANLPTKQSSYENLRLRETRTQRSLIGLGLQKGYLKVRLRETRTQTSHIGLAEDGTQRSLVGLGLAERVPKERDLRRHADFCEKKMCGPGEPPSLLGYLITNPTKFQGRTPLAR